MRPHFALWNLRRFAFATALSILAWMPISFLHAQLSTNPQNQGVSIELASTAPKFFELSPISTNYEPTQIAISPDGKSLVYCHPVADSFALTLRDLTTGKEKEVASVPHATCNQIAFGPDGKTIFYEAIPEDGSTWYDVYRLTLDGASPILIARDAAGRIAVAPDGNSIAFVRRDNSHATIFPIVQEQADGSAERILLEPVSSNAPIFRITLAWSPSGSQIAFAEQQYPNVFIVGLPFTPKTQIFILDVPSGHVKQLGSGTWDYARELNWLPDGSGLTVVGQSRAASDKLSLFKNQLWEVAYPSGHVTQLTDDTTASISNISVASQAGTIFGIANGFDYSFAIATLPSAGSATSENSVLRFDPPVSALCHREPPAWIFGDTLGFLCESPRIGHGYSAAMFTFSEEDKKLAAGYTGPLNCPNAAARIVIQRSLGKSPNSLPLMELRSPFTTDALSMLPPCLPGGRQSAYLLPNRSQATPNPLRGAQTGAVSPDGKLTAGFTLPDSKSPPQLLIFNSRGDHAISTYDIPVSPDTTLDRRAIRWTPDGSAVGYVLCSRNCNVWEQRVNPSNSSSASPPVQLTHFCAGYFNGFDISPEGKFILLDSATMHSQVVRITGLH